MLSYVAKGINIVDEAGGNTQLTLVRESILDCMVGGGGPIACCLKVEK